MTDATDLDAPPTQPPGPVLKAEQAKCWIDGFAFRDRAQGEADALLADTTNAYEAKKREGFETGRREGAAASAELLARTGADVDAYLAGLESALVELSLLIVRRIAGERPAPEFVAGMAREALSGFRRDQRLVVTVAPGNLDEVRRRLEADDPSVGERMTIVADQALGPLDCRVASPYATVDAGLDAQLEAVRRELEGGGVPS